MRYLLLALFPALALAAPQKFNLHEPIPEPQIVACLKAEHAIELAEKASSGQPDADALLQARMGAGECGVGSAVVTYTKRVFAKETDAGLWTVYEGRIAGGMVIYVPMLGFTHLSDA